MIYTITFNPSLDYIVDVPQFTTGFVNRTTKEKIFPGGKGGERIYGITKSRL